MLSSTYLAIGETRRAKDVTALEGAILRALVLVVTGDPVSCSELPRDDSIGDPDHRGFGRRHRYGWETCNNIHS